MDTLQNVESPLFFNLPGNPTIGEASQELARLRTEQQKLRAQIKRVRGEKESAGASLLRCEQAKGRDCSGLDAGLKGLVDQYYNLQGQDNELNSEIQRVQTIVNNTTGHNVSGPDPFLNVTDPGPDMTKGMMLLGKYFSYKEIAAFALTLITVSFALAFPIKQPSKTDALWS